jgi:hypothetical protein
MCLLCGCKGTITSDGPLLTTKDASFPLPSGAELTGDRLDDGGVWERDERKGHIDLVDGSYRVTGPDASSPSSDTFLFKRIGGDELIVQGSNGSEWAYGLIVHADMYYLFTFNRAGENCTTLSAEERGRLHVAVRDDRCYVASLRDLVGLLRYLRRKFPHPTSAFVVHDAAR